LRQRRRQRSFGLTREPHAPLLAPMTPTGPRCRRRRPRRGSAPLLRGRFLCFPRQSANSDRRGRRKRTHGQLKARLPAASVFRPTRAAGRPEAARREQSWSRTPSERSTRRQACRRSPYISHAGALDRLREGLEAFDLDVLHDLAERFAFVRALDGVDLEADDALLARGYPLVDFARPRLVLLDAHPGTQAIANKHLLHRSLLTCPLSRSTVPSAGCLNVPCDFEAESSSARCRTKLWYRLPTG
jgi:hypothetical protein